MNHKETQFDPGIQKKSINLDSFVLNDSVSNTEMICPLQTVMSRSSLNSCSWISEIWHLIIQGNERAKKESLQRTKASYIINDGLAPYYKDWWRSIFHLHLLLFLFLFHVSMKHLIMLLIPNSLICILSILMNWTPHT